MISPKPPLLDITSEGGFVMKYDFIYKMNCVELFRSGRWPDTPEGIGQKNFRKTIVKWSKLADLHGIDVLRHHTSYKEYTAEERYSLVARVLAGESQRNVAISAGIYDSQLSNWVTRYKIYGYEGLNLKKGRRRKNISMKKNTMSNELSPSEKEELIRLRAEIEYLKAENEAIKKLIALRREKRLRYSRRKSSNYQRTT